MRKAFLTGALIGSILGLAACGGAPGDKTGSGIYDNVYSYRGRDIHCLNTSFSSLGNDATLSCDFVRYYNENPDLGGTK